MPFIPKFCSTLLCCKSDISDDIVQLPVHQPSQQANTAEAPEGPLDPVTSFHITVHDRAKLAMEALGPFLRAEEEVANAILSYSELLVRAPDEAILSSGKLDLPSHTFWLTCWSVQASRPSQQQQDTTNLAPQLDLIAMVCSNHLGPLPLLLFSPGASRFSSLGSETDVFTDASAVSALQSLVERLINLVPVDSISAVVGPGGLVGAFTAVWASQTATTRHHIPSRRLQLFRWLMSNNSRLPLTPFSRSSALSNAQGVGSRAKRRSDAPATDDVGSVGCARELAEDDVGVIVHWLQLVDSFDPDQARLHAEHLLRSRLGWVLELTSAEEQATGSRQIVAFCEVSRQTKNTAVLDRIFTRAGARRMGYARYLVNYVLDLLSRRGKYAIVAYAPTGEPHPIHRLLLRLGFEQMQVGETIQWGFENGMQNPW